MYALSNYAQSLRQPAQGRAQPLYNAITGTLIATAGSECRQNLTRLPS